MIKSPAVVTGDSALNAADAVVCPVPPLAIATVPVTLDAVPVVFWLKVGQVNVPVLKLPDVGVPSTGVTKVGEVDNTTEPVPVDVVTPVPPLATARVADKPAAVPVVFWLKVGQVNVPVLKLPDVGVPSTGVTKVGDVAKASTVPVPVVVYEVPQAEPVELPMPAPG